MTTVTFSGEHRSLSESRLFRKQPPRPCKLVDRAFVSCAPVCTLLLQILHTIWVGVHDVVLKPVKCICWHLLVCGGFILAVPLCVSVVSLAVKLQTRAAEIWFPRNEYDTAS